MTAVATASTNSSVRSRADLGGPRAWPLLGNVPQLTGGREHLVLEEWADKYGDVYRFSVGRQPFIAVADPDMARSMLRLRPDGLKRAMRHELFEGIGLQGVFSAEGDEWRRQRKLVMPAFKPSQLRAAVPSFAPITERLVRVLDAAAASGESVDALDLMKRYTVDITTQLVFGIDLNTLEKIDNTLQASIHIIFEGAGARVRAPYPYWRYIKLPADYRLEQAIAHVREVVLKIIETTRAKLAGDPEAEPQNLLEAMLTDTESGEKPMSNDEMRGNLITLLLAGEDTTSNTLTWVLHYMCAQPEMQRKMQEEADRVLPNSEQIQDFDEVVRLQYCEAVIQEALRRRSAAPFMFLQALKDLEVAGLRVDKGTYLALLNRRIAMKETAFGEPERYWAKRWLEDERPAGCPHNSKSQLAFGGGPRICPGRGLALLEARMALAAICKRFTLSTAPGSGPVEEVYAFAMHPKGVHITVRRR